MGVVSLLNDASSEMIYPIWPIFLTSVLGSPIMAVGLIEGLAEAISSIMKVYSGWLSDRLRSRKPFIVVGYSLSTISKFLLGFSTSWFMALLGCTSDRFGKGVRTSARDALIAESTPLRMRGVAFGFHRGTDTVGAIVGPLITLGVLSLVSLRTIFWLAVIPGIISVIILVKFVREVQVSLEEPRIAFSA
jgi:MFS family permease